MLICSNGNWIHTGTSSQTVLLRAQCLELICSVNIEATGVYYHSSGCQLFLAECVYSFRSQCILSTFLPLCWSSYCLHLLECPLVILFRLFSSQQVHLFCKFTVVSLSCFTVIWLGGGIPYLCLAVENYIPLLWAKFISINES